MVKIEWTDEQWGASQKKLAKEADALRAELAKIDKMREPVDYLDKVGDLRAEAERLYVQSWRRYNENLRDLGELERLEEELAAVKKRLVEANKYTNMWADATVKSQHKLKEAHKRTEELENWIDLAHKAVSKIAGYAPVPLAERIELQLQKKSP